MNGLIFKKGSDPCFDIYRKSPNNDELVCVHSKSDPIQNSLNPVWPQFNISLQRLCNNDINREIQIHVWDWDSPKRYKFIGKWTTNYSELKSLKSGLLTDENNKKEGKLGTIECIKFETKAIVKELTFDDFFRAGCQLSATFAVDFTASNGNQTDSSSLHYIDHTQQKPNPYQKAIRSIGKIFSRYDSDNLYPAYFFGAQLGNSDVLHDYPLNFNENNPIVKGIEGIEEAYIKALKNDKLRFFENRLFSPMLERAIKKARKAHQTNKENLEYIILVVLTNDCLDDHVQASDLIVTAANEYLPLSIVIVGVGNSHFPKLLELEGKYTPLVNSKNVSALRRIVRFVELNEISNAKELSYATLKEIPNQFMSYVKYHNIQLNSAKKTNSSESKENELKIKESEPTTFNQTNSTQNENENKPIDDNDLPTGWEKAVDSEGKTYYVDNLNQKTQWERPSNSKLKNEQNSENNKQ